MCPACGRKLDQTVCLGPHPDYRLRGKDGGTSRYVHLPDWWPVRPVAAITTDEPDAHVGVTTSGLSWRIRYDPTERLKAQHEAEKAALAETNRMKARARDLETLFVLAQRLGYVVRPLTIAVPQAAGAIGGKPE